MSTPVWGERCKHAGSFRLSLGAELTQAPGPSLTRGGGLLPLLGRSALLARAARPLRGRSGGRGHGKTPKQGLVRVLGGQAQEQLPAAASRVDFESK